MGFYGCLLIACFEFSFCGFGDLDRFGSFEGGRLLVEFCFYFSLLLLW